MNRMCRYCLILGFMMTIIVAVSFLPSCRRIDEAHGFIKSGKYVVGNGILVGLIENGSPRIAFLTCRHVLTAKMRKTGKSFIDESSEDNRLFLRRRNRQFVYHDMGSIEPSRWLTVSDFEYDFAWIVLSDDELHTMTGTSMPEFVDVSEDENVVDRDCKIILEGVFPAYGIDVGTRVDILTLCSPVTRPTEKTEKYWSPWLDFPWLFLGLTYQSSSRIVNAHIARCIYDDLGRGTKRPQTEILSSWHVNNSGSPLFYSYDQHGGRHSALIGLLVSTSDAGSGFQTLDRVLPALRKSLKEKRGLRLIDQFRSIRQDRP